MCTPSPGSHLRPGDSSGLGSSAVGTTSTLEPETRVCRSGAATEPAPAAASEPGRLDDLQEKQRLRFGKVAHTLLTPAASTPPRPVSMGSRLGNGSGSDCSWAGLGAASGERNGLEHVSQRLSGMAGTLQWDLPLRTPREHPMRRVTQETQWPAHIQYAVDAGCGGCRETAPSLFSRRPMAHKQSVEASTLRGPWR